MEQQATNIDTDSVEFNDSVELNTDSIEMSAIEQKLNAQQPLVDYTPLSEKTFTKHISALTDVIKSGISKVPLFSPAQQLRPDSKITIGSLLQDETKSFTKSLIPPEITKAVSSVKSVFKSFEKIKEASTNSFTNWFSKDSKTERTEKDRELFKKQFNAQTELSKETNNTLTTFVDKHPLKKALPFMKLAFLGRLLKIGAIATAILSAIGALVSGVTALASSIGDLLKGLKDKFMPNASRSKTTRPQTRRTSRLPTQAKTQTQRTPSNPTNQSGSKVQRIPSTTSTQPPAQPKAPTPTAKITKSAIGSGIKRAVSFGAKRVLPVLAGPVGWAMGAALLIHDVYSVYKDVTKSDDIEIDANHTHSFEMEADRDFSPSVHINNGQAQIAQQEAEKEARMQAAYEAMYNAGTSAQVNQVNNSNVSHNYGDGFAFADDGALFMQNYGASPSR
ncbi:hypothetical protein ACSTIN_12885 [Vibrio parahaemolyticus]